MNDLGYSVLASVELYTIHNLISTVGPNKGMGSNPGWHFTMGVPLD
jgi:hypothetical protein